jgi:undecaprenyl-diphosphatase
MTIYDSIILGIVEGITEFLPVSSTAHLVFASELLNVEQNSFTKAYEIIIQIAPIFAVVLIYFNTLIQSLELWKKLIASFIPTGIIGFLFHNIIEELFSSNSVILWMIITGLAFIAVELLFKEKDHHAKNLDSVTYKQAISIGFIQALSLIPGVSRSGSTILGGMLIGLNRETAMNFSFLLAIPTMTIASGYIMLKEYHLLEYDHIELLAVGFIVSFVVGWLAVKSFLAIVSRFSFIPFGIYLLISAVGFYLINT